MKVQWQVIGQPREGNLVTLRRALGLATIILVVQHTMAPASELKVLSSVGLKGVVDELLPQLEQASGRKIKADFEVVAVLKRNIDAGQEFDIAILTPAVIEMLTQEGKITAESRRDVARAGMGIAVRAGAPRPDISSADAFKRTLLAAKSVSYSTEGASGAYFRRLLDRLGIAEEMKPKLKLPPPGRLATRLVADGEVELSFGGIGTLLTVKGIEVVGPLPAELQFWVVFTAGISSESSDKLASEAVINAFTAPTALPVLKAKGVEAPSS